MRHHPSAFRRSQYPLASSVLDMTSVVPKVVITCNDQDPQVVPELAINWRSTS